MSRAFDLVVLGTGFAGSLVGMIGRRLGLSVLMLERGSHPRFAIGESTSPLANLLLEEIARAYDLPRLLPLTAYGTWRAAYPELSVGLKRGFSFFHHPGGEAAFPFGDRNRQFLVAASPNDAVADTHWYRAEFDHFLVQEAQRLGAEYRDRFHLESLHRDGLSQEVTGTRLGRAEQYRARFVVDASGPRGAVARLRGWPESPFPGLPETEAVFAHFTGVGRFVSDPGNGADAGDAAHLPPYPPDDAALHHVFPGGWIWVLRFANGITSAGAALEPGLARALGAHQPDVAWQRLMDRMPAVRDQFAAAEPVTPFIHAPRLPYRIVPPEVEGVALLPSAMAFVDPLLSTGFPLTLLGVQRLGELLRESGGTPGPEALREYRDRSLCEVDAASRLVAACYRCFGDFPSFAALTMLYFAAASYSEMARRLGRRELANAFLLGNRPSFVETFDRYCGLAQTNGTLAPAQQDSLYRELEAFNIAGLCDPAKRNWYGVDLEDVVRGAGKLNCTPQEVRTFFRNAGWAT